MTNDELRAYNLGASDERKRIALLMMNYDVRDHPDDCTCESCELFAEVFRSGFPTSGQMATMSAWTHQRGHRDPCLPEIRGASGPTGESRLCY